MNSDVTVRGCRGSVSRDKFCLGGEDAIDKAEEEIKVGRCV